MLISYMKISNKIITFNIFSRNTHDTHNNIIKSQVLPQERITFTCKIINQLVSFYNLSYQIYQTNKKNNHIINVSQKSFSLETSIKNPESFLPLPLSAVHSPSKFHRENISMSRDRTRMSAGIYTAGKKANKPACRQATANADDRATRGARKVAVEG